MVEVADVIAQVLGGRLAVYDDEGRQLAGDEADVAPSRTRSTEQGAPGRSVQTDDGTWVAVAAAGEDHLGTLVLRTQSPSTYRSDAHSNAARSSPGWCCSSGAPRRRRRAACAASCCPTW